MKQLDYCVFCGGGELWTKTTEHTWGFRSQVECEHCGACGGAFVEETAHAAARAATENWNQIRRATVFDRINLWFVQLNYDIGCAWYKIKHWDW